MCNLKLKSLVPVNDFLETINVHGVILKFRCYNIIFNMYILIKSLDVL